MLVFDDNVVGLSLLHREGLVLGLPSETKAPATTGLCFLYDFTVYFQHIAIVRHQCVFHLACKGSFILTADTYREGVAVYALGKAPGSESREVQLIIIRCLGRLASQFLVIKELHLGTLTTIEVLQVMDGGVFIVKFTCFLVDDVRARHSSLDAAEQ